jgi:hypothetical protein
MRRVVAPGEPRWPAAVRGAGLVVLLAAMLGGCGGDAGPGEPAGEPPPRQLERLDPPLVSPAPLPPETGPIVLPPEELRNRVLADAAELSGVPVAELEVVRSLRVTWRDGSLGCPEPDMNYTMALVPGWHMIIRAGERLLDYRLSSRHFMLCTHPADNGYAPDPDVTVER